MDIAVLEDLVGRDPDVTREFLRAFGISLTRTASELTAACRNKDAALIADLAHKLKAPARSVGALPLAAVCEELERAARATDIKGAEQCLPRFEAEKTRVEEFLRRTPN